MDGGEGTTWDLGEGRKFYERRDVGDGRIGVEDCDSGGDGD